MHITGLSWKLCSIAIALALLSWAGIFLFASSIQDDVLQTVQRSGQMQNATERADQALKLHALARDTQVEREALQGLLQSDPLALATIITQAGRDAGVSLRVSDATPENATSETGVSGSAIGFTVEAAGSFSDLMRALSFLEVLPAPSSIESIDISRTSASRANSWHVSVRVRVLSSAPVS